MLEKPNKKRVVWGAFVVGMAFIIAFLGAWVKLHNVLDALGVGLFTAVMVFIAHWRWSRGLPAFLFPGNRIDSTTPEQDLDEALRKMKEKGEKL